MSLFLSMGCNPADVIDDDDSNDSGSIQTELASDYEWSDSNAQTITFNGTSISSSSSNVTINGTIATITAAGNYIVSGTLTNGQLKVNASGAVVKIQLNRVVMTNTSTSPFYAEKAAKVIVFLPSGVLNTLSDASSYTSTTEPNACIFSNCYLSFTGDGTLNVNGKYADAISSDDQIVIKSGVINVTAVDDGIRGKDYLLIHGGTISATSNSGHALKSDNTTSNYGYIKIDGGVLTLASSSGKGAKAVNKYIQDAGDVTITKSYEGIESINITLNGGNLNVTATNDGLNGTAGTVAGGTEQNDGSNILINGGTIAINCTNGDAIDCNGNATMTGGTVIANGPMSGMEEAVDINGTFNMNGGIFVGAGSNSNMTKAMSTSSIQPNMYVTSSAVSSSTLINIRIGTTDVITFKPKYGGYKFLFSCPEMTKGASYTIYTGGSYSTSTNVNGLYNGGIYTIGTSKKTGTLSSSSSVNSITM